MRQNNGLKPIYPKTYSLDIFEFNKKYPFITTGHQGRKINITSTIVEDVFHWRQFKRQKRYIKDYIIVGIERAWVWIPHELGIGLLEGCLHVHILERERDFYEIQYIKARKRGNKYYKMLFCPKCGEQVDYKKFKALEVMYKLK
jgi:hypothetical protein